MDMKVANLLSKGFRKRDKIKTLGRIERAENDVVYELQAEPFGARFQFFGQAQVGLARR